MANKMARHYAFSMKRKIQLVKPALVILAYIVSVGFFMVMVAMTLVPTD